jgi:large subunit ribosomal protein L18
MLDAGVKIPHSEDILPSTERIQGKHITEFSKNKKDEIQFNNYTKQNINPENISKDMEETKKKINRQKFFHNMDILLSFSWPFFNGYVL